MDKLYNSIMNENTAEILKFPKKKRKYKKRRKLKKLTFLQKIEDKSDPWEIFNVTIAVVLADIIMEGLKLYLHYKNIL